MGAAAPATVVVTIPVKPGREREFREWQEDVNRVVAQFVGFRGTEVVPPTEGSADWTVVYRFASEPQLEAWQKSAERAAVLERGAKLRSAPESQQLLVGEADDEPVTVLVKHAVRPDDEADFRAWQRRVTAAERGFPGYRGSQLYPPVPGAQEEWTALFRFDSAEHLDAWLESPERARLLAEGRRFEDFELRRVTGLYGSWFSTGDEADGEEPARWKTALSILVGLYPTVVLLTLAIEELWPAGELWGTVLLSNVLSVSLLTWVVMPIVTRALRFWLAPRREADAGRVDAIGAAASIGFLTAAALVFWAVTTQVWTLP